MKKREQTMIDEIETAVQAGDYEPNEFEEGFIDSMLRFNENWDLSKKQLDKLNQIHEKAAPDSKILHKFKT